MNLREMFEAQNGKFTDELYSHVLELALDDQKQYVALSDAEINTLIDPVNFPPDSHDAERLDEIRKRLLEAMAIIADIVKRRKLF